ncbi:hypothetical protein [Sandarakinorhabdus sp.]|uniref:hypothetical protein n=1 Tax=Sandarakinorhabdus sp. TaxID=1916663 RepID=UPI003F6FEFE3
MILTHFLVLLSAPAVVAPVAVLPQPATLPIGDAGAVVVVPRALALLPALAVRAVPVLAVRGD